MSAYVGDSARPIIVSATTAPSLDASLRVIRKPGRLALSQAVSSNPSSVHPDKETARMLDSKHPQRLDWLGREHL